MNTAPTAHEIIAAAAAWLDNGAPDASGFAGKVAANALGIVARELDLGPAAEARAVERLAALTGRAGSFADLEAALCDLIDAGAVDLDDPRLATHLRDTARDRLAIDQPRYRSLLGDPPVATSWTNSVARP